MKVVQSAPQFEISITPASVTTDEPFESNIFEQFDQKFSKLPLCNPTIRNLNQQTITLKKINTGDGELLILSLRDFHFTIPLFVHNSVTKLFSDKQFEFNANQEIGHSGRRPDNYFYLKDKLTIVPLLVGEDKADLGNDSDVSKALDILREETRDFIESALKRGYTQIEQNFTPVVLISQNTGFRIYVFQKLIARVTLLQHSTDINRLQPVQLPHKKSWTYDLLDIEDVYYAIRAITALIHNSIKWYKKVASTSIVNRNAYLRKSSPQVKTKQFQYYQSFTLSERGLFERPAPLNHCVHVYKNNDKSVVVKYVEEKECKLYELAASYSLKTLRADVVQIEEEYNQIYKNNIVIELFEGVCDYHANKFIHRDIKPNNLVIWEDKLFFIDFGTAIVFDHEENGIAILQNGKQIRDRCGTSTFMAPEVSANNPYGCKIDCYSCGVVILHLIAQYLKCSARFEQKEQISVENITVFFDELTDLSFKKYKELVLGLVRDDTQNRLSAQQALEMVKVLANESINPSNKMQSIIYEYNLTNIDNDDEDGEEKSEKETNQQEPKFKKAKYK